MKVTFPKTIWVKKEQDNKTCYFITERSPEDLAVLDDTEIVAEYKLVGKIKLTTRTEIEEL